MAFALLLSSSFDTTSGTHTRSNVRVNVDDLIVIIRANTGNTTSTAPTDSLSGSYTLINNALKATSADKMEVWVRTTRIGTSGNTTFTDAAGTTTGGGLAVYAVRGAVGSGSSAVRQSAVQSNQASGTPTVTFSSAALTTNVIIGAVFSATNSTTTQTPRTGYTEDTDVGYATPATGFESMHRNSGETSTSIAWGGASGSAYCAVAVEVIADTSPAVALNTPLDTATVGSTPTLNFTATDTEGSAVEYDVSIDTVSTMDSGVADVRLVQSATITGSGFSSTQWSYPTLPARPTPGNLLFFSLLANTATAETTISTPAGFTALTKVTGASGTLISYYKISDGTEYASPTLTMSTSSQATLAMSEFSGIDTASPFLIENNQATSTGTTHTTPTVTPTSGVPAMVLVVTEQQNTTPGTWSNQKVNSSTSGVTEIADVSGTFTGVGGSIQTAMLAVGSTSGTYAGSADSSTTGAGAAEIVVFKAAARVGSTIAKSLTDSGFTAGHPFASGAATDYTPSTLAAGTYYWRARAYDPTGSNTYGAWATTRSFTISSAVTVTKTQPAIARIANAKTKTQPAIARIANTTSQLVDDFNDNSTNTALWFTFGSVTESSSQLNMATLAAGGTYSGYSSKALYDLTGSYVYLQLVDAGNQAFTSLEVFAINMYIDANNKLFWYVNSGTITAYKKDAGVQTSISSTTYNSTTHKWLRIRESGGTIFWDYSADGLSWTNFTSSTVSFSIKNLVVEPSAGTYAVESAATTAIIDNLNVPPPAVITKTQPAIARISNSRTSTQPAIARIAKAVTKTQPAISRIVAVVTKSQSSIARISATPTKTQPSIARVANSKTATQPATARIATNRTAPQPAIARIAKTVTKTQPAVSRIANAVTKTQLSVARVATNTTKTQTAISRIATIRTATQPAVARVANARTNTQPATANISTASTVSKTQSAIARISNTFTKTQPSTARIANLKTKTQSAIARTASNFTKTQSATANIIQNSTVTKTQPAIARIAKTVTKTQSATSRVANVVPKTQTAVARVATNRTLTQPATARIATGVTKTQPAVARIATAKTKTQPAISRISQSFTKTQGATANIQNAATATKTQGAVARIANTVTKAQSATARVATNNTKTQGSIARVANTTTKTQPAVARVANAVTKTQSTTARVANSKTKTQPAISRIATTSTKVQPAVSRISVATAKTQSATARTASNFTKTQSATANLTGGAVTVTKTQRATASIATNRPVHVVLLTDGRVAYRINNRLYLPL